MKTARDLGLVVGKVLSLVMSALLLVAGLLLAAFLFIRSSVGEDWLTTLAAEALAEYVPEISFTSLRGPLPERLEVQGLRLRDADGVWLEIQSVELVPDWRALLEKRLVIERLVLRAPVMHRVPTFPAAPETASETTPFTPQDITDWLAFVPVECPPVTVNSLLLEDGALEAAMLEGVGRLYGLTLNGRARLTPGTEPGSGLEAELKAEAALASALVGTKATLSLDGQAALAFGGRVTASATLGLQDAEHGSLGATWNVSPVEAGSDSVTRLDTHVQTTLQLDAGPLNRLLPADLLPSGGALFTAPLQAQLAGRTSLGTAGLGEASGRVEVSGDFVGESAKVTFDWQVDAEQASLMNVANLRLAALGLEATGKATLDLAADVAASGASPFFPLASGDVRLSASDWQALARAATRWGLPATYGPLVRAERATAHLTLNGADVRADLVVEGWDDRVEPLRLQASLQGPEGVLKAHAGLSLPLAVLGRIPDLAAVDLPEGRLKAALKVSGRLVRPEAVLDLTVDEVKVPGVPLPDLRLDLTARLAPPGAGETGGTGALRNAGSLTAQGRLSGVGSTPALVEARLAVPYGAAGPSVVTSAPLSGRVSWSGPLTDWWRLLPLSGQRVRGTGDVRLEVKGSLALPELEGEVALKDAAWEDRGLGLSISPINSSLLWRGNAAQLSVKAGDGRGGTLTAEGRVDGPAGGLALSAQGTLTRFAPLRRSDVRAVFSGTVNLGGTLLAPDLRADVTVNEGELRLANLPEAGIPQLPVQEKGAATSTTTSTASSTASSTSGAASADTKEKTGSMNVTVTVPGRFFVRGRGIDSEWQGRLVLAGALLAPRITGELRSLRGTLDLLGKTFTLAVGRIMLDGQDPPNPALDIVLRYAAPAIVAEAALTGSVTRPRLTLSSTPALPRDEVVAHVLFGAGVSSLSRAQALQLAASVASLAGFGDGGLGVLNTARKVLGVDVLRMGSGGRNAQRYGSDRLGLVRDSLSGGEEGTAGNLEAGKYLSDKIYLGVEQGLGPDSGAVRMEVELAPNISLEARTSSKASDIGINWKKDY